MKVTTLLIAQTLLVILLTAPFCNGVAFAQESEADATDIEPKVDPESSVSVVPSELPKLQKN